MNESDQAVRKALTLAIKRSKKKRPQIAEEMTEILDCTVTESHLNEFTRSASQQRPAPRFPAAFIEAFCEVVGNDVLQRHVMGASLRGIVDLRYEQLDRLAASLRTELLKPRRRRDGKKPKGKRAGKR